MNMQNKDELDLLFNRLEGSFDVAEPEAGHAQRFKVKLKDEKKQYGRRLWLVAASITLIAGVMFGINHTITPNTEAQLAEIAPEASQTKFYFANLINTEIETLRNEVTPDAKKLVADAIIQLNKLEQDYQTLEKEMITGGNSKILLSAMITNFQTRIDLLKEVQQQIQMLKTLKNNSNENNIL